MKILIPILILPAVLIAQSPAIPQMTTKPVKFSIIDQDGLPVTDALIEASKPGPQNATGQTDKEGTLVLDLVAGRSLYVYVSKDGYYTTGGRIWSGGLYKGPDRKLVAREIPDDFEIELKKVIEPIQLQNREFRGRAPKVEQPVGFDLSAGDWVAPYGRGSITDLFFHFHDISNSPVAFAGTMSLSFPNEGDGIQSFQAARPFSTEFGSALAPPNRAPTTGYDAALSYTLAHHDGEPYVDYKKEQRNYLLRTRTIRDAQGTIRQACYGWIMGEIEFDPRDAVGPQLVFTYSFNPNPDPEARSLEDVRHVPKQR